MRLPAMHAARLALALIIAAILVAGFASFSDGTSTTGVTPRGRLAERYQTEATEAIRGVAGREAKVECSMMGNVNWGVTCRSHGVLWAGLASELERRGWSHTPQSSPGKPLLSRDRDLLAIEFHNSAVYVSLSQRNK